MEIDLPKPLPKKQAIGTLTKKLTIFQQKVQYRFRSFQQAILQLSLRCFQDRRETERRFQFLQDIDSPQSEHFQQFVRHLDEKESANGSVWFDVAETFATLSEAAKFQEIGTPLLSEDERTGPQLLFFRYVLHALADHVTFPSMTDGFVYLGLQEYHALQNSFSLTAAGNGTLDNGTVPCSNNTNNNNNMSPQPSSGNYLVSKAMMDELGKFLEAAVPLDFRPLFQTVDLRSFCPPRRSDLEGNSLITPGDDDVAPEDEQEGNGPPVGFGYSGFTLTSLLLRIQILETKLEYLAKNFARSVYLYHLQNPDKRGVDDRLYFVQTFLCLQCSELVFTSCTLILSLREILLSNVEPRIGPNVLWDRDPQSLTSPNSSEKENGTPSSTVKRVVKEMTIRTVETVQAILGDREISSGSETESLHFRETLVRTIRMLPNALA
jgi:hypothetical protein